MSSMLCRVSVGFILETCFNVLLTLSVTALFLMVVDAPAPVAVSLLTIPAYVLYGRMLTLHLIAMPVIVMMINRGNSVRNALFVFIISGSVLFAGLCVRFDTEFAVRCFLFPDGRGGGLGWIVALSTMLGEVLSRRLIVDGSANDIHPHPRG